MAEFHSRRALLIGAPTGGLRGVERDLEQMGELLTAHEFHCETCVGPAATRDGILSAISSLAENSTGTSVVYFAGHGGQYTIEHIEADRSPLTLCYLAPVRDPSGASRGVLQVEVLALLEHVSSNVTAIFDCGYSVIKPRASTERVRGLPEREIAWQNMSVLNHSLEGWIHELGRKKTRHQDVVIYATKPYAAAFEAEFEGLVSGHLTAALCASLSAPGQASRPWATIIEEVRQRIISNRGSRTQVPQVRGGGGDQVPFTESNESNQSRPVLPSVPSFNPNSAASRPARSAGSPTDCSDLDLRFNIGVDLDTRPVPEADELAAGAARAIKFAVNRLHGRGISTVHVIDGKLTRVHPDGSQQILEP